MKLSSNVCEIKNVQKVADSVHVGVWLSAVTCLASGSLVFRPTGRVHELKTFCVHQL